MNSVLEPLFALQVFLTWEDDQGQDMVEYALLVGLLSVFALAVIVLVGPALKDTFQTVVNGLAST